MSAGVQSCRKCRAKRFRERGDSTIWSCHTLWWVLPCCVDGIFHYFIQFFVRSIHKEFVKMVCCFVIVRLLLLCREMILTMVVVIVEEGVEEFVGRG